jgi:trimethyllysine dioxygenase
MKLPGKRCDSFGWMPDVLRTNRKFNRILNDPQNQYWTQLEPGMPLSKCGRVDEHGGLTNSGRTVFDNWRVLHGRSVFTGKRRMAGGYSEFLMGGIRADWWSMLTPTVNRDDFISRFKLTNSSREEVLEATVTG